MNSELFNKRYISLGQVHFNDLSKEIQVASYEIDVYILHGQESISCHSNIYATHPNSL
jgi:hypothetical protein